MRVMRTAMGYEIVGLEAYQQHHGVSAACHIEDLIIGVIIPDHGHITDEQIARANEILREQGLLTS